MLTDANMQNSLTTNCQSMHNPSHDCKTDHSGFHAYETHRHAMQQNENSAKLMTADIKTALTRSHKSKFCPVQSSPVRNRPKLWNFQIDNERGNKNFQDTSKLQIHSSLKLTALCTAFYAFSASDGHPCQSLALQPSSQVNQTKSIMAIYGTCPS